MPKRYQVIIAPVAWADLDSIFEYIARHSPRNAATMIERLLDAIFDLKLLPRRYPKVRRRRRDEPTGVRSMPVRPYIIRYRVDEPTHSVHVLTVRHGARG